jgi:hypothetical protein
MHLHKNTLIDFAFISLVAITLTLIWFREGMMMATGEGAFVLYNARRRFNLVRYTWWGADTGSARPHVIVTIPFYLFTMLLEGLEVSNVFLQGATFCFVLALNGLSMYYLASNLIEDQTKRIASILSGLFYMLNPYAMTFIWNRFLLTFIFLTSLLPLMLILYIRGLEEHQMQYTFYICAVSFVFCYALGMPPFIVTIWVPLFSYFIFYAFGSRKSGVIYALKFSILLAFSWLLLNAWWLLQFVSIVQPAEPTFTPSENLGTLIGISELLNLFYVVRLIRQDFAIFWGPVYSSFIFEGISFLILIITFSSVRFKPRNRYVWYFLCLSVLGLFLAKGAAPPFGEVFLWLLTQFPVFGIFRNPFEKFGVILPLAYAFLFGVGLSSWYYWIREHVHISSVFNRIEHISVQKTMAGALIVLISFSIFGVYLWPMWTGAVFPPSNYVTVPSYYQEADAWLSQQPGDFRVISLPLDGEGITYNWTYGYSGIEPSSTLFGKPFISKPIHVSHVDDIIMRMPVLMYRTDKIWKIMALLNAKYLVVNRDIDYEVQGLESPEDAKRQLAYATVPGGDIEYVTQCETVNNWSSYGTVAVLVDKTSAVEGKGSIKIAFSQTEGGFGAVYTLPSSANWSHKRYIEFWLKIDSTSGLTAILMTITSTSGKWHYYFSPPTPNKWTRYVIPINIFCARAYPSGSPTWASITKISFEAGRLEKPSYTGNLWVDDIKIDSGIRKTQQHIHFERTVGNLDFYKVADAYFLEHIYATNRFIFSNDIDSMLFDIENDSFIPGNTVFFLLSQSDINNMTLLENLKVNDLKPKIVFEKMDPTKYSIHVTNASHPFFLVFSETYHPQWGAYVNGEQIPDKYHFIVNGYANAWYIEKTGSFDIILEFWPQKLVYTGSVISLATFAFCMVYLAKDRIKAIYRRYTKKKNDVI